MIINLIFWIYISIVCMAWGNILLGFFLGKDKTQKIDFPITCLIGAGFVGILSLYFSLFIALDWKAHLFILIPCILYYFSTKNRGSTKFQIISFFGEYTSQGYILLTVSIFMILAISSHRIIHPDTLAYHAQSIRWLQNYKAVPGLAHLKLEYGFQNMWFAVQAIFSPGLQEPSYFFYANGAAISWFFLFIVNKICVTNKYRWGWFLLFVFSIVHFTQVRLAAASASTDFITGLFIWAAIYTFLQYKKKENNLSYLILPILFSVSAVSIKFSAIAILLIYLPILFIFLKEKRKDYTILLFSIFVIGITPILIRNFIETGYIFYPTRLMNFFTPDWKLDDITVKHFEQYITAYARFPQENTHFDSNQHLTLFQWIPLWWQYLSLADKILISILTIGIFWNLFFIKKFISSTKNNWDVFIVVVLACLLWFIKAPDTRFGMGFLICLVYFLFKPIFEKITNNKLTFQLSIIGFTILIVSFTIYRFVFFFHPVEIIKPAGIDKVAFGKYNLGKIKMNLIENKNNACGITPVPCITDSSIDIIPRGKTIEDGFKKREP